MVFFLTVKTKTRKIQPEYVSQGLCREAEPLWKINTIRDLLYAVMEAGYTVCVRLVFLSSAGVTVHRTGRQDMKPGKQGHTGTHRNGLGSALVSQRFQVSGAIHGVQLKHTWPKSWRLWSRWSERSWGELWACRDLLSVWKCGRPFTPSSVLGTQCLLSFDIRRLRAPGKGSDL